MSTRSLLVFCSVMALGGGCSETTDTCTFTYTQRLAGNVSTIIWPVGAARKSMQDGYAPDFRWRRADSTLDSLSGHKGAVILLNFWATWCGPCVSEMPVLQSVADEMKDTVFVLAVAVDGCDPFNTVSSFIQSRRLRYEVPVDSVWKLYERYLPDQDYRIPQTFWIGRDGRIRDYRLGEQDKQTFETIVRYAEK